MRFVSFFAGIGGLDLGLERAGMKCVAQVEIDEFCRKVLTKHWPDVPKFGDIRGVTTQSIPRADLWAAGFPCQDVSSAGNKSGIRGKRSGLFFDLCDLVRQVRPRFVLLENTTGLLDRGMDEVLAELAIIGLDVEWGVLCPCAFGAPHPRERVFSVAHSEGLRWVQRFWQESEDGTCLRRGLQGCENTWSGSTDNNDVPPGIIRMAYGVPNRVDRLRSLGNAVVPQVAEFIGKRIIDAAKESS